MANGQKLRGDLQMKKILLILIPIVLSCGRRNDPNETKLNLEHLEKEIRDRVFILSKDTAFLGEIDTIRSNVDKLKFLTIDIENINASIIRTNQYFKKAAKRYEVDTCGFVILYKGTPLQDIENMIEKNHLNLLNKIIIQRNIDGALMLTAQ
jgi:hypothetical protein